MRLLADENVSRLVIERLRAGGLEVISIGETSSGASDKDILEAANVEDCILITEDRDFGELIIRQRLKQVTEYRESKCARAAAPIIMIYTCRALRQRGSAQELEVAADMVPVG